MKRSLAGRTALVTGASQGIGRAIGVALAAEGVKVYGGSRRPELVDWPTGLEPLAFDVSTADAAERSWRASPLAAEGVSILVNNAGAGVFGTFAETDFGRWQGQVELLLLAPMRLAHLALQGWSAERPGALVNVGSLACEFPIPYLSGYNAAKAGLAAFSESLLLEAESRAAQVVELRLGDFATGFGGRMDRVAVGARQEAALRAMERRMAEGPGRVAFGMTN